MIFSVDLALPEDADPIAVADWLLALLCDQDEPVPYASCDGVDPDWSSARTRRALAERAEAES